MMEIYADRAFPGRRGASLIVVIPMPNVARRVGQWKAVFWWWLFAERRHFALRPVAVLDEELHKVHHINQPDPCYMWQHPPINARFYNEIDVCVGIEAPPWIW
jgi:hypothetical protein